jgi:signal transduction histidine kinase
VRVPLRQLVEGAAARARRRGAEVRVDAPDREVAIDPAALEAALDALLDNAARHGAGAPIEVGARVDGGALVIRVRDHGPALAPDHFAHAFERFQTTERGRGGTGIGLALVRAAAEAHGGAATARAAPDGGAEVVVSFERVGVE